MREIQALDHDEGSDYAVQLHAALGVRQLERRGQVLVSSFDPAEHGVGVQEGNLWSYLRIQRTVDGDQIVPADELVEFDVMHMTVPPDLRCMENREHVLGIDVNLGHVVAFDAVTDGDRVEAELAREHVDGLLVTEWDIHPHDGITTVEQTRKFLNRMSVDTPIAHETYIHRLTAHPVRATHQHLPASRTTPYIRNTTHSAGTHCAGTHWTPSNSPAARSRSGSLVRARIPRAPGGWTRPGGSRGWAVERAARWLAALDDTDSCLPRGLIWSAGSPTRPARPQIGIEDPQTRTG